MSDNNRLELAMAFEEKATDSQGRVDWRVVAAEAQRLIEDAVAATKNQAKAELNVLTKRHATELMQSSSAAYDSGYESGLEDAAVKDDLKIQEQIDSAVKEARAQEKAAVEELWANKLQERLAAERSLILNRLQAFLSDRSESFVVTNTDAINTAIKDMVCAELRFVAQNLTKG